MVFRSTTGDSATVTLREAVLMGLAPDGGLWMPVTLPRLQDDFLNRLSQLSLQEIAFEVANAFFEKTIPEAELKRLTESAIDFPVPLVQLSENMFVLELFHGPTLSFKDFGVRFMAHLASYFLKDFARPAIVLVATSGDTGSSVAHAFYRRNGIRVVLLYPSGQVSEIQEKQMTTLGENITALEILGTFDDCQKLVKQAFRDPDLKSQLHLISANSINVARLIPQSFYYFYAYGRLSRAAPCVFSVPSGNFGNLTAGLFAKRMGLPVQGFIAATNLNDAVPVYLDTGVFHRRPSERTISNAMDVGNPSNFARMLALFGPPARGQVGLRTSRRRSTWDRMKEEVSGFGFTDDQTRSAMSELFKNHGYVCDPHTAVAYLGWKKFPRTEPMQGVFLSTAHPAKFANVVSYPVEFPERLKDCLNKSKQSIVMANDFAQLKKYLL